MQDNLDLLLSEGIIDEVLGRLKSGKEADVFRVVYRGEVVVAKVYKDRQQRSFKHNASYKEGRKVRNSRTQRAMDKGSRFGRDEAEDAWKSSEATTLHILHAHEVRVPNPVLFYGGVLLMQMVTDGYGDPAPRLIDAPIAPEHAGELYRDLRGQIVRMLCCDLIHGDLSPYNVLLGVAGPTLIDFPQTISAAHNAQSETFFRRDVGNIWRFFASLDRRLNAHAGDAGDIWRAYTRRDLSPDFVPAAREERRAPPPQQPRGQARRPVPPFAAPEGDRRPRGPAPPEGDRRPRGPAPPEGDRRPRGPMPPEGDRRPRGPMPPRAPGYENAPPRSGQRPSPPQQAARSPVVVYVKRTGTRESAPRPEVAPAAPPSPRKDQPESGHARGERGRRR